MPVESIVGYEGEYGPRRGRKSYEFAIYLQNQLASRRRLYLSKGQGSLANSEPGVMMTKKKTARKVTASALDRKRTLKEDPMGRRPRTPYRRPKPHM